jgi:hypothetical protein
MTSNDFWPQNLFGLQIQFIKTTLYLVGTYVNMEVNDKRFVNVVINQLFLGSINAVLTKSIKFQRTNLLFSVLEMIVKIHELDEKFAVSLLSTGNCVSSLLSILGSVSPRVGKQPTFYGAAAGCAAGCAGCTAAAAK